jgi:hypothetical protein
MSTKERTYSDIEQVVIVAKFKDSDELYQFHVKHEDTAYVIGLMVQLKCPATETPLKLLKFVRPSEAMEAKP